MVSPRRAMPVAAVIALSRPSCSTQRTAPAQRAGQLGSILTDQVDLANQTSQPREQDSEVHRLVAPAGDQHDIVRRTTSI